MAYLVTYPPKDSETGVVVTFNGRRIFKAPVYPLRVSGKDRAPFIGVVAHSDYRASGTVVVKS